MKMPCILSIDQSTAATKALIFDAQGNLIARADRPHEQKISPQGWVSHDPREIYANTIAAVRELVSKAGIGGDRIAAVGISNQRETALVWDRRTGRPLADAVVWQCSRAEPICRRLADKAGFIRRRTGLPLSPYFSASKIAWLLEQNPSLGGAAQTAAGCCAGTMDAWLLYQLTGGKSFATDLSNASRTQLFNIFSLQWDEEVCALFGVNRESLPRLLPSDALFGETDFEGLLGKPVPIHAVLGDSHAAFYGQGCLSRGMIKATYGTGSSVMMNAGDKPLLSERGIVSSVGFAVGGKIAYVLEGNINYSGAVLSWLVHDLGLLASAKEAGAVAAAANPEDTTYLVPAFTGLGAPHWKSGARAMLCGMSRNTGRAEIVRAAEESIAYQIADIAALMREEAKLPLAELRVDGGPTGDAFLMQFQSDILDSPVAASTFEELSGAGAAFAAGIAIGLYDESVFSRIERRTYTPAISPAERTRRKAGWDAAVRTVMS
ncbi:MAG: glycerol kinase GlpK [Treponema sp.]|jgi:glycerol kinase|nr:glycerol kinase GlpK [Treponema sp.]